MPEATHISLLCGPTCAAGKGQLERCLETGVGGVPFSECSDGRTLSRTWNKNESVCDIGWEVCWEETRSRFVGGMAAS